MKKPKAKSSEAITQDIRLLVIPKTAVKTREVIVTNHVPAFKGNGGGFNYVCGFCDTILAENIKKRGIRNKVVQCYDCLRLNEFR